MAKNAFAPIAGPSNKFSRRWGGTTGSSPVDPYITGYHFVNFSYLPQNLPQAVSAAGGNDSFTSMGEIQNFLNSACLSVTLPGGTLNKAEFNGLGNVRWSVPTNVDYDNSCTLRFVEYSGLPVLGIMHGWVRMIRDYKYGTSLLGANNGASALGGEYNKSNYAASMYYWTTEPNGEKVEYYAALTGLFPMKDPSDQFGHDLTSIDKLEIDIDFNVDYMWHESWVKDKCQTFANEWSGAKGTIDGYGATDMNI